MNEVSSEPGAKAPQVATPLLKRMLRAALLHADTYEEVEADPSSLGQAGFVVLISCLAAVGGAYLRIRFGTGLPSGSLPLPWHLALIGTEPLVEWLLGSAFAYMVGATFFRGPETETDYAEVLRTTGFAFGPGVISLFAWVEPASFGVAAILIARSWILIASIVAVRQALDFSTPRAIATYGVSVFLLWLVVWGLSVAPLPF
jgi:hypothetical protein